MTFNVHTNKGVFAIDAKTPDEARRLAIKKHGVQVSKVKLAGGQHRPRAK